MYTVTVPVLLDDYFDVEGTLAELLRAKADRVLLAVNRKFAPAPGGARIDRERMMDLAARVIPVFEAAGLETGIWIGETMGHGGPLANGETNNRSDDLPAYTNFVSINGRKCSLSFCCADPLFRQDVAAWCASAAKAGAKLILLDDDWRMSAHGDGLAAGCMCEEHVRRYSKLAGESLTREEIAKSVFTGAPGKRRELWRKLMGGDMLALARAIREAVDEVDPSCRIGICAAPSVIGLDGSSPMELAETLAGKTRPYLRLIGAPYWAKNGAQLSSVIASERLYAHYAAEWAERTGAEILLEGDAYPRPRFETPASYLVAADQVCRADGHFTGAMLYMMDYYSTPRYEHGYIDLHERNLELSQKIEEMFAGKTTLGFRPLEYRELFDFSVLPDSDAGSGNYAAYERFRGIAPGALTNASVPVSYDSGVPVIFGENARLAEDTAIRSGAILDAAAARILTERGYDVGFIGDEALGDAASEVFGGTCSSDCTERINHRRANLRRIRVKDTVRYLSRFASGDPGAYQYENADGARYVVYPIIVSPNDGSTYFRAYTRQTELYRAAEYITGRPIPAELTGHPDVTVIEAEDPSELAVGIWNLFPDPVIAPHVRLAFSPASIRGVNCEATPEEGGVRLSDIPPFGFAGLVIGK